MPKMRLMSLIWDHRLCYSQIYTAFNVFVYSEKKNIGIFSTLVIFHVLNTKFFLSSVQENFM